MESRLKRSKAAKGKPKSEEHRMNVSKSIKKLHENGDPYGDEWRNKIKKLHENGDPYGDEWRNKMSEIFKNKWENDDQYVQSVVAGLHVHPNKPETYLIKKLEELNLDYKFVGDFKLKIGRKFPDFIDEKNKKIIELFGEYWHGEKVTGITKNQHERERIEYFKKYGYETLIIWGNEIEINNDNNLIKKILQFDKI